MGIFDFLQFKPRETSPEKMEEYFSTYYNNLDLPKQNIEMLFPNGKEQVRTIYFSLAAINGFDVKKTIWDDVTDLVSIYRLVADNTLRGRHDVRRMLNNLMISFESHDRYNFNERGMKASIMYCVLNVATPTFSALDSESIQTIMAMVQQAERNGAF